MTFMFHERRLVFRVVGGEGAQNNVESGANAPRRKIERPDQVRGQVGNRVELQKQWIQREKQILSTRAEQLYSIQIGNVRMRGIPPNRIPTKKQWVAGLNRELAAATYLNAITGRIEKYPMRVFLDANDAMVAYHRNESPTATPAQPPGQPAQSPEDNPPTEESPAPNLPPAEQPPQSAPPVEQPKNPSPAEQPGNPTAENKESNLFSGDALVQGTSYSWKPATGDRLAGAAIASLQSLGVRADVLAKIQRDSGVNNPSITIQCYKNGKAVTVGVGDQQVSEEADKYARELLAIQKPLTKDMLATFTKNYVAALNKISTEQPVTKQPNAEEKESGTFDGNALVRNTMYTWKEGRVSATLGDLGFKDDVITALKKKLGPQCTRLMIDVDAKGVVSAMGFGNTSIIELFDFTSDFSEDMKALLQPGKKITKASMVEFGRNLAEDANRLFTENRQQQTQPEQGGNPSPGERNGELPLKDNLAKQWHDYLVNSVQGVKGLANTDPSLMPFVATELESAKTWIVDMRKLEYTGEKWRSVGQGIIERIYAKVLRWSETTGKEMLEKKNEHGHFTPEGKSGPTYLLSGGLWCFLREKKIPLTNIRLSFLKVGFVDVRNKDLIKEEPDAAHITKALQEKNSMVEKAAAIMNITKPEVK